MLNRATSGILAVLLLGVFTSVSMAREQASQSTRPNAASIIKLMKQALEPERPSVRIFTLKVNNPEGLTTTWRLGQARAEANGSNWMLTVVLSPAPWGKGIALLDEDKPSAMAVRYVFFPGVRRVRTFTPLATWEPFFGSDFSYQDFSFVRPVAHERFEGTEIHYGKKCYKLEGTPTNNPYFSKVVMWVATDTALPVESEYYDVAGKLYKSEHYERVVTIQNVPIVTKIVMKDLQSGGSSEIDVINVKYGEEVPQNLFDPKNLPKAADDQFWKSAM